MPRAPILWGTSSSGSGLLIYKTTNLQKFQLDSFIPSDYQWPESRFIAKPELLVVSLWVILNGITHPHWKKASLVARALPTLVQVSKILILVWHLFAEI